MSVDGQDLVGEFLDEQARINSAIDDGDIYTLITDTQQINTELIGFTGSETMAATTRGTPPHLWDDGQTWWDFFTWT